MYGSQGLSPRSLMKNIPSRSLPGKSAVKVWIREMRRQRHAEALKKKEPVEGNAE